MEKHEFDDLALAYHELLDEAVKLSGETGEFFAVYKAAKLVEWTTESSVGAPGKVLDFGCGVGHMTRHVQRLLPKAEVCGVDPSAESIERAQQENPTIRFNQSQRDIPYADASFDIVYAASVFHHIVPSEHEHYLDEILRVLAPGGLFVMFELNSYNPLTVYTFKTNPIDKNAHMLSTACARTLLAAYGTVDIKYYFFFPRVLAWLRPCEKYLTRVPLGALYAALVRKR